MIKKCNKKFHQNATPYIAFQAFMKDVQAAGEAFIHQKRASSNSKVEATT
jgi:hypothetical protein